MRILRIDLIAFGAFTDAALDLTTPSGVPGLHVVYGPNEAGKTTARRALRTALYGFRHQVEFAFLHDKAALRIGMTVEDGRGERIAFVRRRGNKNTLLSGDGRTALPEETLTSLLAGAGSADEFERAFAIGEAELRSGGEAIVRGEGALSELLFMTAAGLPRLRAVERELSAKAEELFKPTGKLPPINDALARWKDLRSAAAEKSLAATEYLRHNDALRDARAERANIEFELVELRAKHSKLTRLRQAVPIGRRLKQRRSDLAAVADAPMLPERFGETWRALETERQVVASRMQTAIDERRRVESELASLVVPENILAAAGEIERLFKRLGSYEQAVADTPKRLAEIAQFEAEAKSLLREVRPDLDLAQAESVRLTRLEQEGIRELAGRRRELIARQKQIDDRLRRLRDEASAASTELDSLGPETAAEPLRETLRAAGREGDLEAALAEAQTTAGRLRRQVETGLASLSLWAGDLGELARLPVPPTATIDRFETAWAKLEADGARLADRRTDVEERLRSVEQDLARLGRDGDVPTEETLRSTRERRDEVWRDVRQELTSDQPGPNRKTLLATFEAALQAADDAADRLRSEAERTERFQSLSGERERLREELQRLDAASADLYERREAISAEWRTCWPFLTGAPLTPREMREWSARHAVLVGLVESLREGEDRAADLLRRADTHRTKLSAALPSVAGPVSDDASLRSLIDRAERTLKRLDAETERRRGLRATVDKAVAEVQKEESAAASDRNELAELRRAWGEWMTRLGLPPDASPKQAETFLSTTGELFDKLDKTAVLYGRVEQMRSHQEEFAATVDEAASRLAAEERDRPAAEIATRLNDRLAEAQTLRERRNELAARRDALNGRIAQSQARGSEIDAELSAICRQAGCDDSAELPAVEERSARRKSLEREIAEDEDILLQAGGGLSVADFLRELEEADVDALGAELERVSRRTEELRVRNDEINLAIGGHEAELRAMKGDATAAEEAEKAEAVLADLGRKVEQFVRFRLAARLLRDGRERYRQKTGNAVLDHASVLFSGLTCGAYSGLKVDFGENDEPTLLGVRNDGRALRPDAMSDGTADQLYLALRLAGLHAWLDKHEPLPFIVDDLLIHFDDERAAAALKVLAELARRTQVLFFTHHAHLCDLARDAVPADVLRLHELRDASPRRVERTVEQATGNGKSARSLF